jgi:light-regulated signal transduction histidine kinase (bacteriophytochrome)
MTSAEPLTLDNCDREPIHIPGSIQPHGCLLVLDASFRIVLRHSRNAGAFLSVDGPINGRPLEDVVGADGARRLRSTLATAQDARRPALILGFMGSAGAAFDVSVHQYKSSVIVELERSKLTDEPLMLARQLTSRIEEITDLDRLTGQAARVVRAFFGYDRVMVYRFEQDGSGKVVSEVKRHDLESFLGQYFPASDIPQQARLLYLRNTIRIISDAGGARVEIEPPLDASGEPVDLSFAHLRSVSPVHLEYLRNMGVCASMSISIIVDGSLWGLVACHHYAPRVMKMSERVAAEMFGEFLSLHIQTLTHKQTLMAAAEARRTLDRVLTLASHHTSVSDLVKEHLPSLMGLIPASGIGLWMNGTWSSHGVVPPSAEIPALAAFVASVAEGKVWATHYLSLHHPKAQGYAREGSGVLAVPLSQIGSDYLLFFRSELVHTLDWAGNPEKTYEVGPLGDRLTPRKSFAIWKEIVHQQTRPWTEAERETAEAMRVAIVDVLMRHNELVADERSKADVRQKMLNQELNHRVKNILAIIKSLVSRPVEAEQSLTSYVRTLSGRIQALSFAHDQIVRGEGGGLLSELVNAELAPYEAARGRIEVGGPAVWLDARAFSVMALVLHELATNAAKYGSLSVPAGRLRIGWTLADHGECRIEWTESGGPAVSIPKQAGFGTALIERSIPFDLSGRTTMEFDLTGLRARLELPRKHVRLVRDEAAGQQVGGVASETASGIGSETHVFIVEDQMLIAMDLEGMLEDAGVRAVSVANSVREALAKLEQVTPDVAVLDVNLGDETSIPIAEELARRAVPFVFATGYGEQSDLIAGFPGVPVVRKPYQENILFSAIETALAGRR